MNTRAVVVLALATLGLAGCASGPARQPESQPDIQSGATSSRADAPLAERIVAAARGLIGSPYRYGGAAPEGFDCSGLVFFVHGEAGMEVPRTAREQFFAARPVNRAKLEPGDLVFFSDAGHGVTHVGIFVGEDTFVHAPKTGRPVEYARLDEGYYAEHFAGAGRFR